MSMIVTFTTARDATLAKVRASPELAWQLLDPEGGIEGPQAPPDSVWSGIVGRSPPRPAPPVPQLQLEEGEGEAFDVDKAWHGLHFLLTGSDFDGAWPACFICNGGDELLDIDAGYGPPRLLDAGQVREVAAYVTSLTTAELRAAYDPEVMMELEIYPTIWDRDGPGEDALAYLLEHLCGLRNFLIQTAERGLGLIIDVS